MAFKYVALLVALLPALTMGIAIEHPIRSAQSGFTETCTVLGHTFSANTAILSAICGNGAGGETVSSIDLNECVTNNFGVLQCSTAGGFIETCDNLNLADGAVLEGNCGDDAGGEPFSELSLDLCITNTFGQLTC